MHYFSANGLEISERWEPMSTIWWRKGNGGNCRPRTNMGLNAVEVRA